MEKLPENARLLGQAGLLPQLALALAVFKGGALGWTALALAYAYAALIFSFLGGVWWGIGIARPDVPRWFPLVAVVPSLIGALLWLPWMLGWSWPGPQLYVLGGLIIASPLVDRALGFAIEGWLSLRWQLSLGLGGLTLLIAAIAQ